MRAKNDDRTFFSFNNTEKISIVCCTKRFTILKVRIIVWLSGCLVVRLQVQGFSVKYGIWALLTTSLSD